MTLTEGQLLHGRYQIEHLVGRGGYGAVYKAFDITLNRICAVKENLVVGAQAERQFEREAQLLARLHHPNLPRVVDYFLLPGKGQYLVMDYVEGRSLQSILRHRLRPLSQDEALAIIEQICAALAYLHRQSPPILHRDVKPQNIIITPAGTAMLVDFGVSKVVYTPGLSVSSDRGISPGFAAPEQYGAQPTDERSDVYSVGATLYAMLTGQPPADAWQRVSNKAQVSSIRQSNGSVSASMEQVIYRSLALSMDQRIPSIDQFQAALHSAHSSAQRRGGRLNRSGRAGLAVGAGMLALLVCAALLRVVPLVAPSSTGAASGPAVAAGGAPTATAPAAPTATAPAAPTATVADTLAPVSVVSPGPPQPEADTQAQPAGSQEGPSTPTPGPASAGTADATTQEIAITLSLTAWLNPTSTPLQPTPTQTREPTPTAPPTLAVPATPPPAPLPTPLGGGGLIIFDAGSAGSRDLYSMLPSGSTFTNLTSNGADDWTGSLSTDGRLLVFASNRSGNWEIYVKDLEQGGVSQLTADTGEDHDPAWSPDGKRILFHSNRSDGIWRIYTMAPNGSDVRVLTHDERGSWAGAWSPDGNKIAFSVNPSKPGEIYVMNADGSNPLNLTNNTAHESTAHWSPDGSRIVFYSDRDGNQEIYVMDADGNNQQRLTDNPALETTPTWSPDGTQIVFASDRQGAQGLYRLELATGLVTPFADLPAGAGSPIWAPY